MLTKKEIFEQDVASKLAVGVGDGVSTAIILDAMAKYAKEVALAFYENEESVSPVNMEYRFDKFIEPYEV
jgi:hypothetical protein